MKEFLKTLLKSLSKVFMVGCGVCIAYDAIKERDEILKGIW